MSTLETIVSIHGVPRSGTTWLAELLCLHESATLRYQPFFSYRFKNLIDIYSTSNEVSQVLDEIYRTEDPFILQKGEHRMGLGLQGPQKQTPTLMIMKSVRYHELIPSILSSSSRCKVIGIVRHPCAVINSWLNTEREFNPQWDPQAEWLSAPSKNIGDKNEYWGFERWHELTRTFLTLEKEFPKSFRIVQYEKLVDQLIPELRSIADWLGYTLSAQIISGASMSQNTDNLDHNYDVIKNPRVKNRWQIELDSKIKFEIISRLKRIPEFERFNWTSSTQ